MVTDFVRNRYRDTCDMIFYTRNIRSTSSTAVCAASALLKIFFSFFGEPRKTTKNKAHHARHCCNFHGHIIIIHGVSYMQTYNNL